MQIHIIDCNPVVGHVNFGSIEWDENNPYDFGRCTKMRCYNCGAAWLAENYIDGRDTCPECGSSGKKYIKSVE